MSQETETEFINGQEPATTPAEDASAELREAEIFNWSQSELSNGSSVFTFTGNLEPGTVGIMNRNGYRNR